MADDDYRLRLATALVTRNPVGILVDALMAVRDDQLHAAEAAIARVRQLHAETPHNPGTCYCANPYPCPTIRALDGEDTGRG